jgi:LDH2 family malate/lactate/ureidoglycolate dehydrogenase
MAPFEHLTDGVRVDAGELRVWTSSIVRAVGTPDDIAEDVADVLTTADLRGIASHGTSRLPVYVSLAEAAVLDVTARPERLTGAPALALWDAHDGWGPHAGRVLMDDVIERARRIGMATSLARRASHYSIAGWYAMRAARAGLIGLSMTNTSPLVAPTRGHSRLLGTNPIAFAAPAGRHGMLVLDMATSTVTWGRLLVAARRESEVPSGVAIDGAGRMTTHPREALTDGALLPLGGLEETGGYKGYGLALMVDVLTGVLAGANSGPRVIPFSTTAGPSNLGQLFMAIDPAAVDSGFVDRLEILIDELVGAATVADAPGPVLIPGQPETEREREQIRNGVLLDGPHHRSLFDLGARMRRPFPRSWPA